MTESPQTSAEVLMQLRQKLAEFQQLGIITPESFGTYQQTVLQVWQEAERRRVSCLTQAESLRAQAQAAEYQASAFGTIASILYAVINGHVEAEQRRIRELQERDREDMAAKAVQVPPPPRVPAIEPADGRKRRNSRPPEKKPMFEDDSR